MRIWKFNPHPASKTLSARHSKAVESTGEAAIEEALSLWEERERRRADILRVVEKSEASLAQGSGTRVTSEEESRQFARDIAERGKARLAEINAAH